MKDRFRCVLWLSSWSTEYLEGGDDWVTERSEGGFGSGRLFSIGRSWSENFGEDIGSNWVFAEDRRRLQRSGRNTCVLVGLWGSGGPGVGFGCSDVLTNENLELEIRC